MRIQTSVLRVALALALVLSAVFATATPAMAQKGPPACNNGATIPVSGAGITPNCINGNQTCQQLGYTYGWKIDRADYFHTLTSDGKTFNMTLGWGDPVTQHGFETEGHPASPIGAPANAVVTVKSSDGKHMSWESNLFPIAAVIMKGGPNENEYVYIAEDELYSDTGLRSPLNPGGEIPNISHITFCWNTGATYVELDSFTAKPVAEGIALEWTTAVEVDNAGFNLYRSQTADGVYAQVNAQLIASTGNATGDSYSYTDATGSDTHYYVLEDVDFAGKATRHGPVRVQAEGARVMSQGAFLPIVSVQ